MWDWRSQTSLVHPWITKAQHHFNQNSLIQDSIFTIYLLLVIIKYFLGLNFKVEKKQIFLKQKQNKQSLHEMAFSWASWSALRPLTKLRERSGWATPLVIPRCTSSRTRRICGTAVSLGANRNKRNKPKQTRGQTSFSHDSGYAQNAFSVWHVCQ